jgi:L-ascorbate metabolism protein UlaG (beta-lactamase superfamily)
MVEQAIDQLRVDPQDYAQVCDHTAPDGDGVRVTFLGVSTLLIDDGHTKLITDGYFSRAGCLRLAFGLVLGLSPNRARVTQTLDTIRISTLNAVIVAHSHFDHALDSALVAEITESKLYGSLSTRHIAQAQGFDLAAYRLLGAGTQVKIGDFAVTAVPAQHSPGYFAPGHIRAPVSRRPRVTRLRMGECYSFHIAHPAGKLLVHASANYLPGVLDAYPADTVYLGIGALGRQPAEFLDAYWREVVEATKASTVVPIHWDNFTRSLTKPARSFPRCFDHFDTTMRFLQKRCQTGEVVLALPQVWQQTNPFARARAVPTQEGRERE